MAPDTSNNNEERRSRIDRRQFSFCLHLPERRSGKERRNALVRENNRKIFNREAYEAQTHGI
jgi:hypothetical protein